MMSACRPKSLKVVIKYSHRATRRRIRSYRTDGARPRVRNDPRERVPLGTKRWSGSPAPENGREITRQLSEIIDNWNATHTDKRLNRKLLQDDAITFVAKLLSSRLKLNVKNKDGAIEVSNNQPTIKLLNKHSKRGAVGLAKLVTAIDTEQVETVETQPKKKDAVAVLKQAWLDADKPCNFDDVLAMFLPDRQYIEDENGYSVSALTKGIIVNIRAGNLRAA